MRVTKYQDIDIDIVVKFSIGTAFVWPHNILQMYCLILSNMKESIISYENLFIIN